MYVLDDCRVETASREAFGRARKAACASQVFAFSYTCSYVVNFD